MILRFGAPVLLLALAAAVLCGAAAPAAAQKTAAAPLVAIIVDVQLAQRETLAGKALIAERDKHQQRFQTDFNSARQQLQTSDQDLARQKGVLAAEVYEQKAKALEQQVMAFQRRTQLAVRALDKATETVAATVMNAILSATGEIANEMGANLVLPKQQVVLHEPRMDVTAQVIERVNRRMPTIDFPVPVVDESSAPPIGPKPGRN